MQAHKQQIVKRVYKVGEVIEIPTVKKIKKGVYKDTTKSFKINLVDDNKLYGEYLN